MRMHIEDVEAMYEHGDDRDEALDPSVTSEPVAVTDADWDARVLGGDTPVLVDFWAPWCAPCRKVEPIVRDLAARYAGG